MDEPKGVTPVPEKDINRRSFLNGIAATALTVAAGGSAIISVRYFSPNVLFEPPTSFRIGRPENYSANSITLLPNQQVFIVRSGEGFMALSAVCTHLGCITQWDPAIQMIACPCHGSRFKTDGAVAQGPAPRALDQFTMRIMQDGTLLVDKLEIVLQGQILKV